MEEYNDSVRNRILKERFGIWKTFLRDLEKTAEADHSVARFPNSSTYIFSTGRSTFWMMDPSFGPEGTDEEMNRIAELICQKISFIVITHLHDDHCQFDLVKRLSDSPVRWIVPQNCAELFRQNSGIPEDKILVLAEGDSTELYGIRITEHPGYHFEPGKTAQVLSGSYEITLPDRIRLFFPADVRNYQAPLPELGHIDYTFGHVFLGREDATDNEFSLLDDFCRFMMRTKCSHLILAHLYETGRLPRDLWTFRHASLVRERMKELAPEIGVLSPGFGDALHLVKDQSAFQDPFLTWSDREREEFFSLFGISIKKDHREWMEQAIREKVPVLEWLPWRAAEMDPSECRDQLVRWRENGGRCLSLHFPDFPLVCENELWDSSMAFALKTMPDRITVHVPGVTLKEMAEDEEKTLERILKLCGPLLDAGIRIGIENFHMKPQNTTDENRPFGFIPPECVHLVKRLREKSGSTLWGAHFDIGHAYSNPPYHERYDTAAWIRECGPWLNGMHLHQFEHPISADQPFLVGHGNVTGRNTGHPSLLPVFAAWAENRVRVPMILEITKGVEPDPFDTLRRLKRIFLR